MTSYQSGMTLARLRRSVERDSYSDYLPLAAWVEEAERRGEAYERGEMKAIDFDESIARLKAKLAAAA